MSFLLAQGSSSSVQSHSRNDGSAKPTSEHARCLQVVGATEPQLWQQLALPFQELWLRWAADAGDGGAEGRAAVSEADRLAFAQSLLAQGARGGQPEQRESGAPAKGDVAGPLGAEAQEQAVPAPPLALTREQEQVPCNP